MGPGRMRNKVGKAFRASTSSCMDTITCLQAHGVLLDGQVHGRRLLVVVRPALAPRPCPRRLHRLRLQQPCQLASVGHLRPDPINFIGYS